MWKSVVTFATNMHANEILYIVGAFIDRNTCLVDTMTQTED